MYFERINASFASNVYSFPQSKSKYAKKCQNLSDVLVVYEIKYSNIFIGCTAGGETNW